MIVPRLALQSLRNRALTAFLTVLAIAFSVTLLLGVEKVRTGARQSFADTISGTDLIVGARSGSIQLLLYSVFRIGNATMVASCRVIEACVAQIAPVALENPHASRLFAAPRLQKLRALDCAAEQVCDQCAFGQPSRKRTKVIAWHGVAQACLSSLCNPRGCCRFSGAPHVILEGLGQNGQSRTSLAAAYPWGFARAGALLLKQAADNKGMAWH